MKVEVLGQDAPIVATIPGAAGIATPPTITPSAVNLDGRKVGENTWGYGLNLISKQEPQGSIFFDSTMAPSLQGGAAFL
jgi:hypothetical protein